MAATPAVRVGAERETQRPFATLVEQLRAVRVAATHGTIDPRLRHPLLAGTPSGMHEGVGSEGGFLVWPFFAEEILQRAYQTGQILRRVRTYSVPATRSGVSVTAHAETSRADGQRLGGVQAFWASEADQATARKPKFRRIELSALKKVIGLWYMSSELDDDSPAAAQVALDAFADEVSFTVEDAIVNGTGAGQPLGLRRAGALITQAIEGTQTIANTENFISANVRKMHARLFLSRDPSAVVWLVHQELLPALHTLAAGPGGLYSFTVDNEAPDGRLLGRPVLPSEYCQPVGTPGDLIFTDLAQYLLGDKAPSMLRSIHVRFLADENAFRFIYRVDGAPGWEQPTTPRSGSNTVSSIVALGARS